MRCKTFCPIFPHDMATAELACIYSSLILADDNVAITADKINTLVKAAKIEIEPFWSVLYAKALNNVDVKELISNMGSGVSAGPIGGVSSAPQAAAAASDKKEEGGKGGKKEEAKKEESEESDADMGFGLFD